MPKSSAHTWLRPTATRPDLAPIRHTCTLQNRPVRTHQTRPQHPAKLKHTWVQIHRVLTVCTLTLTLDYSTHSIARQILATSRHRTVARLRNKQYSSFSLRNIWDSRMIKLVMFLCWTNHLSPLDIICDCTNRRYRFTSHHNAISCGIIPLISISGAGPYR